MSPGMVTPFTVMLLGWLGWPAAWDHAWPAGLLAALLILAVTFVAGWFLKNVIAGAMRKLAARTETDLDDQVVALAEKPVARLVQMIGVYMATLELPFPPRVELTLTGALLILVVWVSVRVASQIGIVLLLAYGRRVNDDAGKQRFEKDYVPLLSKITGTVFALMGLIAVLHHFGQDVSSVVAALGIGGLAISFAAKETLGNMFAGFTILLDRPFRPGDRIRLATGEIGDVLEVGTRSTRLRLLDQNMLIVPNSELVNSRVVNYNFPSHSANLSVEVTIAYGSDLEQAKRIVLEAVKGQTEVTEPPGAVLLTAFAGSGLSLTAWFVIRDFTEGGGVLDRIRVRIYNELRSAGIKIPYPTQELIHVGPPPKT